MIMVAAEILFGMVYYIIALSLLEIHDSMIMKNLLTKLIEVISFMAYYTNLKPQTSLLYTLN